jgi:hypothetical protein
VGLEQPHDASAKRDVLAAGFVQIRRALIARKEKRVGKHLRFAID